MLKNCAKTGVHRFLLTSLVLMTIVNGGIVYGQQAAGNSAEPEHGNLSDVGRKLSNPVSNVWAMFTEFDFSLSDGNLNEGYAKVGERMIFQPVLPVPLFGSKEKSWNLITRPIIPILFAQPVPAQYNDFNYLGGIGDIQLPAMISPPTGKFLLGAGPTFLFPTASRSEFGNDQWGIGPAFVVGYSTPKFTAGIFPQYTFGLGDPGNPGQKDVSNLSLLYFFIYNLPNTWQVGFNPTITYDRNAPSDRNKNIPIGIIVAKMTKWGKTPVKIQLGLEYSVVSQLPFGQQAQVKLNIIPVIPSLVGTPIFGGK